MAWLNDLCLANANGDSSEASHRDTIAENDYNLAASRYKPLIAELTPDEDPAGLIRETLAIEREIAEGLEKLLKEIEAK